MGSRSSICGVQALVQARGRLGSERRRVPQSRAYLAGWREMQTGERAIEHPPGGEAGHQGSTMAKWMMCESVKMSASPGGFSNAHSWGEAEGKCKLCDTEMRVKPARHLFCAETEGCRNDWLNPRFQGSSNLLKEFNMDTRDCHMRPFLVSLVKEVSLD